VPSGRHRPILAQQEVAKPSIFACLATTALGNFLIFVSDLNVNGGGSRSWNGWALACMLTSRVVMGLGVGGIDAVIPVYSSELSSDGIAAGAPAQEFQMYIFDLLKAFSINLGVMISLRKDNQLGMAISHSRNAGLPAGFDVHNRSSSRDASLVLLQSPQGRCNNSS
jgi:MFS family permease